MALHCHFISSAQPLAGGAYLMGLMSSVVLVVVVVVVRCPSSFHSNAFSKTTYWIFVKLITMVDNIMALDSMERFSNFSQNSNFSEFF